VSKPIAAKRFIAGINVIAEPARQSRATLRIAPDGSKTTRLPAKLYSPG